MEYKGYVAAIAYDDYADVLHGRVINAADYSIVTFEASDVEGLKREFAISIDEYLASCEEDGVEPEKPYSGKVELKIGPKLHRTITLLALEEGITVNSWIENELEDRVWELAHPGKRRKEKGGQS